MANEANIKPAQPIAAAVQSLADLGAIQVNLAVKSIEALTPVTVTLSRTMADLFVASVNLAGSAAGMAVGVVTSAGGTLLNAMVPIAVAPLKVMGSLAGALVSTAQSGVGFLLNAVGSLFPARKPA